MPHPEIVLAFILDLLGKTCDQQTCNLCQHFLLISELLKDAEIGT